MAFMHLYIRMTQLEASHLQLIDGLCDRFIIIVKPIGCVTTEIIKQSVVFSLAYKELK